MVLHSLSLENMGIDAYYSYTEYGTDVFRVDYPDNTFRLFYGKKSNENTILWIGWC